MRSVWSKEKCWNWSNRSTHSAKRTITTTNSSCFLVQALPPSILFYCLQRKTKANDVQEVSIDVMFNISSFFLSFILWLINTHSASSSGRFTVKESVTGHSQVSFHWTHRPARIGVYILAFLYLFDFVFLSPKVKTSVARGIRSKIISECPSIEPYIDVSTSLCNCLFVCLKRLLFVVRLNSEYLWWELWCSRW